MPSSPYRLSARTPPGPPRPDSKLVRLLLVSLWALALYGLYVALDSHACMSTCGATPPSHVGAATSDGRPTLEWGGGGSGARHGRSSGAGAGRAGGGRRR
jgi:hypothetical protein